MHNALLNSSSALANEILGTDHPFFPPLDKGEREWQSVTLNSKAVKSAFSDDTEAAAAVMGGNAVRILRLGNW